jgi:hypothetical protein
MKRVKEGHHDFNVMGVIMQMEMERTTNGKERKMKEIVIMAEAL